MPLLHLTVNRRGVRPPIGAEDRPPRHLSNRLCGFQFHPLRRGQNWKPIGVKVGRRITPSSITPLSNRRSAPKGRNHERFAQPLT